jgi:hypothetical protein
MPGDVMIDPAADTIHLSSATTGAVLASGRLVPITVGRGAWGAGIGVHW